jgi:uncharacterized RDD family membrane protein YckC
MAKEVKMQKISELQKRNIGAPIYSRVCAFFIDLVIIGIIVGLFAMVLDLFIKYENAFIESSLLYFIITMSYYILFSAWQATPGMKLVKIKFIQHDQEDQLIELNNFILRFFLFLIYFSAAIFISLEMGYLFLKELAFKELGISSNIYINYVENFVIMMSPNLTIVKSKNLSGAMLVSIICFCGLLYLPTIFIRKKQTLYDLLSKIFVVKE